MKNQIRLRCCYDFLFVLLWLSLCENYWYASRQQHNVCRSFVSVRSVLHAYPQSCLCTLSQRRVKCWHLVVWIRFGWGPFTVIKPIDIVNRHYPMVRHIVVGHVLRQSSPLECVMGKLPCVPSVISFGFGGFSLGFVTLSASAISFSWFRIVRIDQRIVTVV